MDIWATELEDKGLLLEGLQIYGLLIKIRGGFSKEQNSRYSQDQSRPTHHDAFIWEELHTQMPLRAGVRTGKIILDQ